jgi:hypothetical protein
MTHSGSRDANYFVLRARHDDKIGTLVVEKRLQDRRKPEEIATLHPDRRGIVGNRNAGDIGTKAREPAGQGVHRRPGSKACTSAQSSTKARA